MITEAERESGRETATRAPVGVVLALSPTQATMLVAGSMIGSGA